MPDVRSHTSLRKQESPTAAWPSGTPAGSPHGEDGLTDRSSRPIASPNRTSEDIADPVEALRRQTKYGPARLAAELQKPHGITVAPATVHRVLVRRGLSRLRDLDPPTGEQLREVVRYEHDRVGDLVHVDVKKPGGIPAGGGWRMHDRGTEAARAAKHTGPGTGKVGYTYLHTAINDHSRLAYTEALDDEKAVTAAAFWHRSVARQRLLLPLSHLGRCPGRDGNEAQAHQAVHATDKREGGEVQRDAGPRVGLRARPHLRAGTQGRARELPQLLQPRAPHSALGGRPPISRTSGSDYRIVFDQPPKPLDTIPQQLTFEDAVEPTS
ncbi:hypothetical protein QFZ66_001703 [Streptomyces sp. B4I13]|nr:hypothetical protein [Streptomyces sp. B4I13]